MDPADRLERRTGSEPPPDTPLWLAHHASGQYDRCVVVGGRHVCRRCLVLYPVALSVLTLAVVGLRWSAALDPWVVVLLPLPAVVEWWLEHLGRVRYSPTRQVAVTTLLGLGLGGALVRYLERPTDPLFWGVVLVYGGACAGIALWRFLDEHAP